MSQWDKERQQLAEAAWQVARLGLVSGSSGNASLRLQSSGLVAVTPSRRALGKVTPEEVVIIDSQGEPVEGDAVPSSESLLHLAVYKTRKDVRAVIHTHSVFASVLAVAGVELPPIIDEMVLLVGGPVPVAQYAFPGTEELAQHVCQSLEERNAVILRNHGLVGVGSSLAQAVEVCTLVERAAQIYVFASLLGKVQPLPQEVVEAEVELFRMRRQVEEKEGE